MPTYQVRKTKQKKKGRGNITQIVSVVVQSGRGKTSRPRAPTQNLEKFMLTRPTPPQVITVPSQNPFPSPELARVIANQEKQLDLALAQQALLASRMSGGFQRDAEGVLQPSVSDMEKEALRQQLQQAQQQVSAQMTMMGDLLRKQEATAVRPPTEFISAPPPPPPPPKGMTEEEKRAIKEKEAEEKRKRMEQADEFQKEIMEAEGKSPSEIAIDKQIEAISRRPPSAQITQLERPNVRANTIKAYIRYYDLDPNVTKQDIIEYIKQTTGTKKRGGKKPKEPEYEDEGTSSSFRQPEFPEEDEEALREKLRKP